MSFATGYELGLRLQEQQKKYEFDSLIDSTGKTVADEIAQEKEAKRQQDEAQQKLFENARPTPTQETPGMYQQGGSLGLTGYQTGNKPVEATVPTAPAGYGMREDETAPTETLLGNYGTTAAFKGEKPTAEDTLRMQKDTTDQFQTRPFTGKNEQVANVADLAVNKPVETTAETATPKPLELLNNKINDADLAKESYNYHRRVIQKLEQGGNPRAALEYGSKLANSELTLAQADQIKFNTTANISKQIGNLAANALVDMQQPGVDVNKIYFDFLNRIKEQYGFAGKIPFSLDPKENMKYLDRFQQDAMSVTEKSELNLKSANSQIEKNIKLTKLAMDQEELTLKKLAELRAQGKETREEAQAVFTRYVERAKILQNGLNALNEYQDEPTKKAYKTEMDTVVGSLKAFEKDLGVKSSINLNTLGLGVSSNMTGQPGTTNVQPEAAPAKTSTSGTQQVNPGFSEKSAIAVGEKPLSDTAGGYPRPESVVKTPAQIKTEQTANKKASSQIEQNNNRIKTLAERLTSKKSLSTTDAQRQIITDQEVSKIVKAQYDKDWNKTKAFWSKVAGVDDQVILDKIEELKKQNKELETK